VVRTKGLVFVLQLGFWSSLPIWPEKAEKGKIKIKIAKTLLFLAALREEVGEYLHSIFC